jgi:LPXTG-motif cell wall-anchored protein
MTPARSHGSATTVLVAPGSGYSAPHGSAQVRAVQHRLAVAGYSPGPIDGRYGPLTVQSVMRFQAADGLQVDGIAGPHTLAALTAPTLMLFPGTGIASGGSAAVRALQRELARTGYSPGPIDGRYGPLTERSVMRFQAAHGLQRDGIAGPRTFADLRTHGRPQPKPRHVSRRVHSRPPATHHHPQPAPTPKGVRPVSHPTGSSFPVWLALVGAIGLGLGSIMLWRTRRRPVGPLVATDRPLVATPEPPSVADDRAAVKRQSALGALRNEERRGDPVHVEAVRRRAEERGDASGAFNLGVLLEHQGDRAGAEAAYRQADQHGHAAASCNLGVLLEERGDVTGAEAAYRRAEQRGDANGPFNLGVLLEQQGDRAGAEAAYRQAAQRGHAAASCNLGVLLEEQGDLTGAEAAYRRAEQNGDANGAFNLGVLLEQQGELVGAQTAYRQADRRGSPEVAMLARAALHDLHRGGDGRGSDGDGGGRDA